MSATPFDYNGDGFSDVFWVNANTGQNLIWNMVNNQFNSQQVVAGITVPDNAISISGDFNGNGTTDVFQWNDLNGQTNNLLFNNDQVATTVPLPTTLPASGWFPEISGDFNGDGRSDLLWHNFTTNDNVAWQINNSSFVQQATLPDTAGSFGLPRVGNFDSDPTSEIFWHNTAAGGGTVVWNLSNLNFVNQVTGPNATFPPWFDAHQSGIQV